MCFIDVTLDVSKLSGWLNADAPCRVTRTAYMHTMRGEVRALCGSGRGTTVWVGCGASGGHAYNARRGRLLRSRGQYDAGGMQAGRRRGVGRPQCMQPAGEGPNGDRWGGARAERTRNMACMVVTLDVLKLSGWLNADAFCRVARRA